MERCLCPFDRPEARAFQWWIEDEAACIGAEKWDQMVLRLRHRSLGTFRAFSWPVPESHRHWLDGKWPEEHPD